MRALTVAQKVTLIKQILNEYGIQVAEPSLLQQIITSEFGPGKRSKLNTLLPELLASSDAAQLAACIGVEISQTFVDHTLTKVGAQLQSQIPALLDIISAKQQQQQRAQLVAKILQCLTDKMQASKYEAVYEQEFQQNMQMLVSAVERIQLQTKCHAVTNSMKNAGIVLQNKPIIKFATVIDNLAPILFIVYKQDIPREQKINYLLYGLQKISQEFPGSKMSSLNNLATNVYWLNKSITQGPLQPKIYEQIFSHLNISVGSTAIMNLKTKFKSLGIKELDIAKIIYNTATQIELPEVEANLLSNTHKNQGYATVCALAAQIGKDLKVKEIEKVATAGLCLAALRQTYVELKTKNLQVTNFSESLGLILSGVGTICSNPTLFKLGNCITAGLKTYLATPGGAAVAIPLALCTVLQKIISKPRHKNTDQNNTLEQNLPKIIQQFVAMHTQIRNQIEQLHLDFKQQHNDTLNLLDDNFTCLKQMLTQNRMLTIQQSNSFLQQSNATNLHITQEFSQLYLSFVQDSLQQLDFIKKYKFQDVNRLQQCIYNLYLWLLYKSSDIHVNGLHLYHNNPQHIIAVIIKSHAVIDIFSFLNAYSNDLLNLKLATNLPHLSSWLHVADCLHAALADYQELLTDKFDVAATLQEINSKIRIISEQIETLALNTMLWIKFDDLLVQDMLQIKAYITNLLARHDCNVLRAFSVQLHSAKEIKSVEFMATPSSEQLELFTSNNLDVTEYVFAYLLPILPEELLLAWQYCLIDLTFKYSVDQQYNNFHNCRCAPNLEPLPDDSRDVLFRLELYVTCKFNTVKIFNGNTIKIATCWLAYDLQNGLNRYSQYYQNKFTRIRHSRYYWISLDGLSNQIEHNSQTNTVKPINYASLANIYKNWFAQTVPVNQPQVIERLRQNYKFYSQYYSMIEQKQTCIIHDELQSTFQIVQQKLLDYLIQKRIQLASSLQQDQNLSNKLTQLQAKYMLRQTYHTLLTNQKASNRNRSNLNLLEMLQKLLENIQNPQHLQQDYEEDLLSLVNINLKQWPVKYTKINSNPLMQTLKNLQRKFIILATEKYTSNYINQANTLLFNQTTQNKTNPSLHSHEARQVKSSIVI